MALISLKKSIALAAWLAMVSFAGAQQLTVYPAPAAETDLLHNDDFTVKVRKAGGSWQDLYEYDLKVDEVQDTRHTVMQASMCSFDFSGEVEVAVTPNKNQINTARIRPLSHNITHKIAGNTLYFKLKKPVNLSVEINGDIFHNLHLFANPIDDFKVNKEDRNLIYFGPGVHEVPGGKLKIASGKTVYVAGGAVIKGQLLVSEARDVKIMGRGIIDFSVRGAVQIERSRNILVEGLALTQCPVGGSDSVTIKNVKSISYYGWGDGMNVFASNNVLYDGVFCRNSDDCTTVYATRKGFTGGCRNIVIKNATLWADVAHPIMIGIHGNAENPDTIQNLIYTNIDILDHKEAQLDYQGCFAINAGDNNLIKDVKFEDIRVEDFRQGQLLNIRVFYNKKYCKAPGFGIENVLFKNIVYSGNNAELSMIAGYDSSRMVKNITFENLLINGKKITDNMLGKPAWYKTGDMARIFIGAHVENIIFK